MTSRAYYVMGDDRSMDECVQSSPNAIPQIVKKCTRIFHKVTIYDLGCLIDAKSNTVHKFTHFEDLP